MRWRKVTHGSIVAPSAVALATLAATMAVGVGVALARAERERREERERRLRDGRFELLDDERLGEGLQRMAVGQLDIAIDQLAGEASQASFERSVHETRKALKRLRALMRLLEDELGSEVYSRESKLLRHAGERLAVARDAEVSLETLESLIRRHPRKLGRRRGVLRLRARLQSERDGAAALALADQATRDSVLEDLRGLRARVLDWELSDPGGIETVEPTLERLYRKGARRMRKAARAKGQRRRSLALHAWRKRVKDLRYAAEMLDRSQARGHGGGGGEAGFTARVARRADELGELLGEEHDLWMLAERVRKEADASRAVRAAGPRSRAVLLKRIKRRRRKLRKRALHDGERLYPGGAKRFVRRVRAASAIGAVSRR